MTLKTFDNSFSWEEFVEQAIYHAKDLFIKEMGSSCLDINGKEELTGIGKYLYKKSRVIAQVYTIDVFKVREFRWWQFFRGKNTVSRNVLRVTDILGPNRLLPMEYMSRHRKWRELQYCFSPPVTGEEPLKCELFLNHPGLRDIAQRVLEPMAKQLQYSRVEYIDMSKDKSAWYPGEFCPELPKARLLGK